jgi:cellulose synthase/poly-beta-1,6-N-acetylglucosamine synthase-like glycosyltransferase
LVHGLIVWCAGVLLLTAALSVVAITSLVWMLYAWRTPEGADGTQFAQGDGDPRLSFSVILPARHEERVLGATLDRLASSQHPRFEILCVVGEDDPGTYAVATEAAARNPGRIRVLIDEHVEKNKPKALNTALPFCRGEIVAVFDAEDEVHPQLLRRVDLQFQITRADALQAGVQLMNFRSNWYSLRNVLEYWFWFRSRLHMHASRRFIPLGGNSVFVRRVWLERLGGWDETCLAEDCDLGVRLSSNGARIVVAYDPELVTHEETPPTLRAFFNQRVRWQQGFLQVYRKRDWAALPHRRQRLLARCTLAMPMLQALGCSILPLAVLMVLYVQLPAGVALLTFVPVALIAVTLCVEVVALHDFCRTYGHRLRVQDCFRLVVGTIPFQLVLACASVVAVVREVLNLRNWVKTDHVGAHRGLEIVRDQAAA